MLGIIDSESPVSLFSLISNEVFISIFWHEGQNLFQYAFLFVLWKLHMYVTCVLIIRAPISLNSLYIYRVLPSLQALFYIYEVNCCFFVFLFFCQTQCVLQAHLCDPRFVIIRAHWALQWVQYWIQWLSFPKNLSVVNSYPQLLLRGSVTY